MTGDGLAGWAPATLFARSRVRPRTLGLLAAAVALSCVLENRVQPVPFFDGDAAVALAPLLPVVPAVFVGGLCGTSLYDQEVLVRRSRMTGTRLMWAATVTVLMIVVEALAAGALGAGGPAAVTRNTCSFVGCALLSAALGGRGPSWLLPGCLAFVTFVLGKDADDQVRPWAWLLQSGMRSWAVSMAVIAVGLAAYVCLDCRVARGDD